MINWAHISLRDFAGFISEELRNRGVDTILVGGACVTIYTANRYQSYDLDYVTYEDLRNVKKILTELGFTEKQKYFQHKDCPWLIEFVSPPVAVGAEFVTHFNNVKTPLGTIKMLLPIDSVKDRLASFYHWGDKMSLDQAVNICIDQKIDFDNLEEWSRHEKCEEKFKIFKMLFKNKCETQEQK